MARVSWGSLIYLVSDLLKYMLAYFLDVLSECFYQSGDIAFYLVFLLNKPCLETLGRFAVDCLPLLIILLKLVKGHKNISRVCSGLP
jgi:hypothetical protein